MKTEENKNYTRDGPEGQSKKADSAMCNAGRPPYSEAFMSAPESSKVSMKKGKEERRVQTRMAAEEIYSIPRGGQGWQISNCEQWRYEVYLDTSLRRLVRCTVLKVSCT